MSNLTRPLFCPICGCKVYVPATGAIPESYRIPEHKPKGNVNLCAAVVVTVTLDYDKCLTCGAPTSKHPSQLCPSCFRESH